MDLLCYDLTAIESESTKTGQLAPLVTPLVARYTDNQCPVSPTAMPYVIRSSDADPSVWPFVASGSETGKLHIWHSVYGTNMMSQNLRTNTERTANHTTIINA